MNIKKIIVTVFVTVFSIVASPAFSNPNFTGTSPSAPPKENVDVRGQELLQRLHEIKEMSKANLTSQEKKDLRHEVKDIRKELRVSHKGLYLSLGAIIIIILLLILLLG